MKRIFIFFGTLAISGLYAQQGRVGVNTMNPKATLDIQVSPNAVAGTNEGILIPRISKEKIAQMTTPETSTLVYVNDVSFTTTEPKVANITKVGFYHYNGTEWVAGLGDDTSIYTQNGTLSAARIVNMGAYNLSFIGAGNVGIGVSTPTQKLDVGGNIVASGYVKGASLDLNSDKRLKVKINGINREATEKIQKLNPVTYYWNAEGKAKGGNDKLQYGLIAQELETIFPDMVNIDEKGYKSVNYIELIPILLKAIQEQQKEIEYLKSKIN